MRVVLQDFIRNAKELDAVINSDADWMTKFEIAFSVFKPLFDEGPFTVLWDDPDLNYEQDARAYNEGVKAKARELMKVLAELETEVGT